jgi:hypothetical protein
MLSRKIEITHNLVPNSSYSGGAILNIITKKNAKNYLTIYTNSTSFRVMMTYDGEWITVFIEC